MPGGGPWKLLYRNDSRSTTLRPRRQTSTTWFAVVLPPLWGERAQPSHRSRRSASRTLNATPRGRRCPRVACGGLPPWTSTTTLRSWKHPTSLSEMCTDSPGRRLATSRRAGGKVPESCAASGSAARRTRSAASRQRAGGIPWLDARDAFQIYGLGLRVALRPPRRRVACLAADSSSSAAARRGMPPTRLYGARGASRRCGAQNRSPWSD
jgi:hypothetical protein